MKISRLFLFCLLPGLLFLTTCSEPDMEVYTGEVSDILPTTVKITGRILSAGDGIKQYGHCYSKTPDPAIFNDRTEYGVAIGAGSYTSILTSLEPGTKYYAKAYISCDNITIYGNEVSFTTVSAGLPELTTTSVSDITSASAVSGGVIINDGGTPVLARGVCWSLSSSPTTSDSKTADGSGTGSFSSNLTGLPANTTYYIRAYARNGAGTSYGNELSFTTSL